MTPPRADITQLLHAWSRGDQQALNELIPAVYGELKRIARMHLSHEQEGHTLETTALVHEAYLRLIDQKRVRVAEPGAFFAIASRQMRRTLVDHYRSRQYAKRGGGAASVEFDENSVVVARARDVIALEDALTELASFDERKCRIVKLRFFAGLSIEETAAAIGVSPGTVMRDWTLARAWLQRAMINGGKHGS